jgi:hypothetical protein
MTVFAPRIYFIEAKNNVKSRGNMLIRSRTSGSLLAIDLNKK